MTASDRREQIRNLISFKRETTVAELMSRFNVSKNTILHDLDILTPTTSFTTVSGRGGGIYASPGWYASSAYLNKEQENLLKRLLPQMKSEADIKTLESIIHAFGLPESKRTSAKK